MSWILHDTRCLECEAIARDVAIYRGDYPVCERCGGATTWIPTRVQMDVLGAPTWSDAAGCEVTSQREKRKILAREGYHEAGDPVGGARHEHRLRHTALSDPKVRTRTRTGERRLLRA